VNLIKESIKQLLGSEARKPAKDEMSAEVKEVYIDKKSIKLTKADMQECHDKHAATATNKWLKRRWITLLLVNFLFLFSYALDIQVLEGALTASRFVGFHMADLNSALQVTLAFKVILINLIIGTVTIFIAWFLLGGRTFCSWVCPYHLLAEWAESLHLYLAKKGLAKDYKFDRKVRSVFYIIFVLLALGTGYTVYEFISPTGILSRALIYGPTIALAWVAFLLAFEVFVSRRAWCRYVCPIGITYGLVGIFSPLRVSYNMTDCHHEGDCRSVCLVPHVLDVTIKNRSTDVRIPIGSDCTRCGLCIDVCPTNSLTYEFKGLTRHEDKKAIIEN